MIRSMLKALVPHLVASATAALIGAVVGGLITGYVVTKNSRAQLVAGTYDTYLSEAGRALIIAEDSTLAEEDQARLLRATTSLLLTASEEVMCWALQFEGEIKSDHPDAN